MDVANEVTNTDPLWGSISVPDMSAELLGENSLLSACWKRILSVLLCSSEPHLWLKKQESTFKFRESISIICSLVIKPYPFFFSEPLWNESHTSTILEFCNNTSDIKILQTSSATKTCWRHSCIFLLKSLLFTFWANYSLMQIWEINRARWNIFFFIPPLAL